MSSRTIAGTASRKTDPHQKCSSISPPATGPIAAPDMKQASQTPIATARCFGWRNMVLISDSVDGDSVAPALPSTARAAISMAGLVE